MNLYNKEQNYTFFLLIYDNRMLFNRKKYR